MFRALMSDNPRQVLLDEGVDPDELMDMLKLDRDKFAEQLLARLKK